METAVCSPDSPACLSSHKEPAHESTRLCHPLEGFGPRPLSFRAARARADDVVIEILYCGVCHSDIHNARNDWGNAKYPMVPGHEIIGRVVSVGAEVTRFKPGDPVGVGCMVDSCRHCKACARGWEQYCENGFTGTYNDVDRHDGTPTFGGYSDRIVVSERFVLRVPAGLRPQGRGAPAVRRHHDLVAAAPLEGRPGQQGGGGRPWRPGPHGVEAGQALGAEVTLFTRSPGKEQDALPPGRRHGRALDRSGADGRGPRPVRPDHRHRALRARPQSLHAYAGHRRHAGPGRLPGPAGADAQLRAPGHGAQGGGGFAHRRHPETQELLDFCGEHGITSDVEVINIQEINAAFARVLKSDVKYRFVIDMASLKT